MKENWKIQMDGNEFEFQFEWMNRIDLLVDLVELI